MRTCASISSATRASLTVNVKSSSIAQSSLPARTPSTSALRQAQRRARTSKKFSRAQVKSSTSHKSGSRLLQKRMLRGLHQRKVQAVQERKVSLQLHPREALQEARTPEVSNCRPPEALKRKVIASAERTHWRHAHPL